MDTHERPAYWQFFARWVRERCSWIGPLGERITAAFIASSDRVLGEILTRVDSQ